MLYTVYLDGGVFGEFEYEFEVDDNVIWDYIEDEVVDNVLEDHWDELVDALKGKDDDSLTDLLRELAANLGPMRLTSILTEIQNEGSL